MIRTAAMGQFVESKVIPGVAVVGLALGYLTNADPASVAFGTVITDVTLSKLYDCQGPITWGLERAYEAVKSLTESNAGQEAREARPHKHAE